MNETFALETLIWPSLGLAHKEERWMMRRALILAVVCAAVAVVGRSDDGVPPTAHPDSSGWQDLFAPDLSNATFPDGVWSVRDGLLIATKNENLWTKEQYANFIVDLEFQNGANGNSGLFIYASDLADRRARMEVQILDDHDPRWANLTPTHVCGSICGRLAPAKRAVKKPGEWNRMTVWCLGPRIFVLLNGERIIEMDLRQWTLPSTSPDGRALPSHLNIPLAELPAKGHLGLQGKHGSSDVLFRNVKIKPLSGVDSSEL